MQENVFIVKKQKPEWVMVEKDLIRNGDITALAKVMFLEALLAKDNGEELLFTDKMAEKYMCRVEEVEVAISELAEHGYLTEEGAEA